MSLITCCPSCGTKFRVVADQLRISEGWVRCGRCQEVFDASQALEALPAAPVAAAPDTAPVQEPLIRPSIDRAEVAEPEFVTELPCVDT